MALCFAQYGGPWLRSKLLVIQVARARTPDHPDRHRDRDRHSRVHCRMAATMSTGRKGETFQPVTMGHIRGHGVTRLIVYCESLWCNHSATLNADWLTDDNILLALEASKKAPTIAELRKQRGDLPRSRPVTTGWTQSTSHTS